MTDAKGTPGGELTRRFAWTFQLDKLACGVVLQGVHGWQNDLLITQMLRAIFIQLSNTLLRHCLEHFIS